MRKRIFYTELAYVAGLLGVAVGTGVVENGKSFTTIGTSAELMKTQIKVLRLVCEGLEYGEIAEKLNCSVNTVKTHIANILRTTGYGSKTRLAIAVTNKRFIIPDLPEDKDTPVIK